MKYTTLLLSLFIVMGCSTNENGKSLSYERKQLFDQNWTFQLGNFPDAAAVDFDDAEWRKLDLPHDWSIEGEIAATNPSGNDGGYFPTGIGWYRKTFVVPESWSDKQIHVYFEGVYMNAEVFINGISLGVYPYGYSSFFHNLTPYLKAGDENVLAVKVDNSQQKNCRWYSGSGIYRHVWLQVTENIHVEPWGVAVRTPEVSPEKAGVEIEIHLKNESDQKELLTVQTTLVDKNGNAVGESTDQVEVISGTSTTILQNMQVQNPDLWDVEVPNMYAARVQVLKNGKILDEITEAFGIRSIHWSADKGFQLNGESIQLNGGCVHHDNGCLGAKAYDAAEVRKVRLLKDAGYNAVRTAHNPPSEAFLHACDSLGLLVIDEAFDGWRTQKTPYDYAQLFDEWAVKDVQAMVRRDRNHPSIVMWSIGNEIIERKEPEAVETAKLLSDAVKEVDTTRPVTSAMTSWDSDWEIFDPLMAAHDICGYNYMMHKSESDHERVPSRIIVQTESYPRDAFYNWQMVQNHDYVIGDFVWTAIDYLGESSIGRYYYPGEPDGQHWTRDFFPWHGAYCGDIDLLGWRKPISHYRDMLWNGDEKLYLAVKEPHPAGGKIKETMWSVFPTWESWTWPGYEGKSIDVEIYSRYPSVRLYLNGELLAEKATGLKEEFKATIPVPYAKGVLKVVGVQEGIEKESRLLKTAEKPVSIRLHADRQVLHADGQDLAFVQVEIVDEHGQVQPNGTYPLHVEVSGNGVLEGVDNAHLKNTELYVSHTRNSWKGKALAVVKSTPNAGSIKVTVSAAGISAGTLELTSY